MLELADLASLVVPNASGSKSQDALMLIEQLCYCSLEDDEVGVALWSTMLWQMIDVVRGPRH
jgi:hypothetical protein